MTWFMEYGCIEMNVEIETWIKILKNGNQLKQLKMVQD